MLSATQQSGSSIFTSLIPFLIIIVVFWVLLYLPQRRREKEHQKLIASLKKGDKVITSGGIIGTITNVKDKTVVIRIDDKAKMEVLKSSVIQKIEKAE